MRFSTSVVLAMSMAAVGSMAAPLMSSGVDPSTPSPTHLDPAHTGCGYTMAKTSLMCARGNNGYPDGVPVTYDMTKRSDVEAFMNRGDAMEVIARGMREEMDSANKAVSKRDTLIQIDHSGDLSKTQVKFDNGTSVPLSQLAGAKIDGDSFTVDGKTLQATGPAAPAPASGSYNKVTDDHSDNHSVSSTVVGLGSGCNFGSGSINRRIATCEVGVKRDQVYGDNGGGGNAQGNMCNFGNGNIGRRDQGGAYVACKQYGSPTYGPNGGNTVLYGKRDKSGSCKYYEQRSLAEHEAHEAHIDSLLRRGVSEGNVCAYGNKAKRDAGGQFSCEQDCSPIYGPNGGSATYFTRSFDVGSVDDVLAYHNEVRAALPNADKELQRRGEEPCDGIPVGPVGPQVTYVTGAPHKRAMPIEFDGPIATKVANSNHKRLNWAVSSVPTPAAKAKRCINTPIAPVGPSVTNESYSDYKKSHPNA